MVDGSAVWVSITSVVWESEAAADLETKVNSGLSFGVSNAYETSRWITLTNLWLKENQSFIYWFMA